MVHVVVKRTVKQMPYHLHGAYWHCATSEVASLLPLANASNYGPNPSIAPSHCRNVPWVRTCKGNPWTCIPTSMLNALCLQDSLMRGKLKVVLGWEPAYKQVARLNPEISGSLGEVSSCPVCGPGLQSIYFQLAYPGQGVICIGPPSQGRRAVGVDMQLGL